MGRFFGWLLGRLGRLLRRFGDLRRWLSWLGRRLGWRLFLCWKHNRRDNNRSAGRGLRGRRPRRFRRLTCQEITNAEKSPHAQNAHHDDP